MNIKQVHKGDKLGLDKNQDLKKPHMWEARKMDIQEQPEEYFCS